MKMSPPILSHVIEVAMDFPVQSHKKLKYKVARPRRFSGPHNTILNVFWGIAYQVEKTSHVCHQWSPQPDQPVPPVAITILTWYLFCFARFLKVEKDIRTDADGRTDTTFENSGSLPAVTVASWIKRFKILLCSLSCVVDFHTNILKCTFDLLLFWQLLRVLPSPLNVMKIYGNIQIFPFQDSNDEIILAVNISFIFYPSTWSISRKSKAKLSK